MSIAYNLLYFINKYYENFYLIYHMAILLIDIDFPTNLYDSHKLCFYASLRCAKTFLHYLPANLLTLKYVSCEFLYVGIDFGFICSQIVSV